MATVRFEKQRVGRRHILFGAQGVGITFFYEPIVLQNAVIEEETLLQLNLIVYTSCTPEATIYAIIRRGHGINAAPLILFSVLVALLLFSWIWFFPPVDE